MELVSMTKDEALKLALEALMYASYEDIEYDEACAAKVLAARDAIKEALAQPEPPILREW
jgi:20S proteasome alpha/beta subunit